MEQIGPSLRTRLHLPLFLPARIRCAHRYRRLTVTLPEPDSGWRKAGKGNLFNGQNYLKDDGQ